MVCLDAGYLSCLKNPTDACIFNYMCDAKDEYVLASYQKTVWDLHLHALTGVFKFELTVCLGYHSCLTQRLGSHKHTESVVYLLPCNITF